MPSDATGMVGARATDKKTVPGQSGRSFFRAIGLVLAYGLIGPAIGGFMAFVLTSFYALFAEPHFMMPGIVPGTPLHEIPERILIGFLFGYLGLGSQLVLTGLMLLIITRGRAQFSYRLAGFCAVSVGLGMAVLVLINFSFVNKLNAPDDRNNLIFAHSVLTALLVASSLGVRYIFRGPFARRP